MDTKSRLKVTMVAVLMAILFVLSACTNESSVEGGSALENDNDVEYMSEEEDKPVLYDIIVSNMDDWEFASDEVTQEFTYDKVECTQLRLSTGNTQGEYCLVAIYVPTDAGGFSTCQRIYYISNGQMNYEYSNILRSDDFILNNYTTLFIQSITPGGDKLVEVENLVNEALLAEEKYYSEIALGHTEDIELTDEEIKLYQNLYKTILELEYDEDSNLLVEINCYSLGGGKCEAMFNYGIIWYGETEYISYGDKSIRSYLGYSIDENGYDRLSYDEEKRLRNTTNIITIDWNPDWTTEKKEYTLKEAIHNNI